MKLGSKLGLCAALMLIAGGAMGLANRGDDGIKREGTGQQREALDAMELKPFDTASLALLSNWTNGDALTAESMKGKVVVFASWATWSQASVKQLANWQKLQDQYSAKGLVIVGVHHKEGWNDAASTAAGKGAKFLLAFDADNKFRDAMHIDQDPDIYLVDRAGNLRFADIMSSSLDKAAEMLVAETADQAGARPAEVASAAAKAAEAASRTVGIKGDLKPGQVLNVAFTMPKEEAYKSVKWPEANNGQLTATNVQGQRLPNALGNEQFITEKPVTTGRVIVLDFWATWCGPCKAAMPKLDALQNENRQDLCIIGISDEDMPKVKGFLDSHHHDYYSSIDTGKTVSNGLQVQAIPHVVVISSDGVVRWQGNPHDEGFRSAVLAVINADPGVKARREAERAYLKSLNG